VLTRLRSSVALGLPFRKHPVAVVAPEKMGKKSGKNKEKNGEKMRKKGKGKGERRGEGEQKSVKNGEKGIRENGRGRK